MENSQQRKEKNLPVKVFRLHGVSAKVFEFKSEHGSNLKVVLARSYFDKKTDKWESTPFFNFDDMPLVSKLACEAYKFISERQDEQQPEMEAVEDVANQVPEMAV